MIYQPHPAMNKQLLEDLFESDFIKKPMPLHEERSREVRCAEKPILASRLLDSMESLDNWTTVTEYAHIEISKDRCIDGESSLKMTAPCKLDDWPTNKGRIYTVPKAMRIFDRENWEDYNQLSVWIYPDMPGYRNVCFRVQLHNDGEHKVPDAFDRDGGHNVNLKNHEWNHVTVEIPYVYRDEVIGVSFDYDMVGNEPCASGTACWYIDKLELQKVEADVYEGWDVGKNRIAFSHSGYQPGTEKTAIASTLTASEFSVIDTDTKETVLTKPIETVKTMTGEFQVMNFTELTSPGTYYLKAGEVETRTFEINERVWMGSIWKTINFFFCQRCGYRVPGKHEACHTDQVTYHDGKSMVCNGGWHDAADTNQQQPLTCEVTYAMFDLAMSLKDDDTMLYKRVLEEAVWGLNYLIKGRFGDGYRVGPASSAVWTDGIRGTKDDLDFPATNGAFENLLSSSAESIGYRALLSEDEIYAKYSLACAEEDFHFAMEVIEDGSYDITKEKGHTRMTSKCLLYSCVAQAALELYRNTGKQEYADYAAKMGEYIVSCQQREYDDTFTEPFIGFYYRESDHKNIIHYNHRSHEEKYTVALIELCRQLPDHPDWMKWYSALMFHADYVKRAMRYVEPYGMLPSGIYKSDEIDDIGTFGLMHPISTPFSAKSYEEQVAETFKNYQEQLDNGVKVGPQHYMRRFPVWYSFRGNFSVQLSLGKAVSASSIYLNDESLYNIAQRQFEWIIGKNPFAESIMYGEGYDYCQQYAVLPGETTGELPVGMESNEQHDSPFWPQVNNCTYKEVWVAAPAKWLWMMADAYLPGKVTGAFDEAVTFTNDKTGAVTVAEPVDGKIDCELSAGAYTVSCGTQSRKLTVVAGGKYVLANPLMSISVRKETEGDMVKLIVSGCAAAPVSLELRTWNLKAEQTEGVFDPTSGETIFTCTVENRKAPWAAVVIPDGNLDEKADIMG